MPSKQVWENKDGAVYTTSNGAPVSEPYAYQRAGVNGPLLLQGTPLAILIPCPILITSPSPVDFHHIDLLAHFDRERIPERVVSITPHKATMASHSCTPRFTLAEPALMAISRSPMTSPTSLRRACSKV